MKRILFSFLLILVNGITYGRQYDTVIIPVTANKLQDEIISKDVLSILNGKANDNLYEYKTKGKGNLVATNHRGDGWCFYVGFSEKIRAKKVRNEFDVYCSSSKFFLEGVRFYHVKYMLAFTPRSLNTINREIASIFGGQSVSCVVKSYISKDRLKNYLYLSMENGGKKLEYVLIIKNSEFYQCIINKKHI